MSHWQLRIKLSLYAAEIIGPLLQANGARFDVEPVGGTREAEPVGETQSEKPPEAYLVATFDGAPELRLIDALGSWLSAVGEIDAAFETRGQETMTWSKGWGACFKGFQVSPRIRIQPVWEERPADNLACVILDPGPAFGAGDHPTTKSILTMLDHLLQENPGASVLDIGTGSGIIAIAAAHLGSKAVGIEIDSRAVQAAIRNVTLNGVDDRVTIIEGSVDAGRGTFDIVVANILKSVLIPHAATIRSYCRKDLLLSGFLLQEAERVLEAYGETRLIERREDGVWTAVHLRVEPDSSHAAEPNLTISH